jgi:hypothetical protein
MPTLKPLMTRPTINMAMFWEAQTKIQPMHLFDHQKMETIKERSGDIPNHSTNHDRMLTAKDIGEVTRAQSAQPRATRHRGGDTTLDISRRTLAIGLSILVFNRAFVEVAQIGLSGDNSGHRRDIETKEATTDDGDGRNGIHVPDLPHGEGRPAPTGPLLLEGIEREDQLGEKPVAANSRRKEKRKGRSGAYGEFKRLRRCGPVKSNRPDGAANYMRKGKKNK